MPRARVWTFSGFQLVGATLLSRVFHNGVPITKAGLNGITVTVKRFNAGDTPAVTYGPAPLVVANTVFDVYQTDARWTQDTIGYNFAASIPNTAFPEDDEYWVAFVFDPTSGTDFLQLCRGTILPNLETIT